MGVACITACHFVKNNMLVVAHLLLLLGGASTAEICGYSGFRFAGNPTPFTEKASDAGISYCMQFCVMEDEAANGALKNRQTVSLF